VRLRGSLFLIAIAALGELVAVTYWIERAGFDCYPRCDAGQVISGWTALVVPCLVAALLIASLARWLWEHRRGDGSTPRPLPPRR
jgi:hypothetical protein